MSRGVLKEQCGARQRKGRNEEILHCVDVDRIVKYWEGIISQEKLEK